MDERERITVKYMDDNFNQVYGSPLNRIMGWPVWSIGDLNIMYEGGSFCVSTTSSQGETNYDDRLFGITYVDQLHRLIDLLRDCNYSDK